MKPDDLYFFCDESSHRVDKYMVVSGIAIRCGFTEDVRDRFIRLRTKHGINSEMKWEKCKPHRLNAYKEAADLTFDLLNENRLHFHCLITDFKAFDHRRGGQTKDKSESVGRMLYLLALHRTCKPYGKSCKIHIRPDGGDCSSAMPRMRPHLNGEARQKWRMGDPIASIDTIDSSTEPLLQLNDIILGAIASHRNARHLIPGAAAHKTDLAAYVLQKTGLNNYATDTAQSGRLTVWNFKGK